jgi:hypothetical protein
MRGILASLMVTSALCPAIADEWVSRTGPCYDWEAYWNVERDASGVWVGNADFRHIGGACIAPNQGVVVANEVRAVLAGDEFFAVRTTGFGTCHLHGRVRNNEVRGLELCTGQQPPFAFALRFSRQ